MKAKLTILIMLVAVLLAVLSLPVQAQLQPYNYWPSDEFPNMWKDLPPDVQQILPADMGFVSYRCGSYTGTFCYLDEILGDDPYPGVAILNYHCLDYGSWIPVAMNGG